MDVLLIVPPYLLAEGNIWNTVQARWPPVGLLSVAAFAEARGHEVHVLDVLAEQSTPDEIEDVVRNRRPQFVGISATSIQIAGAHKVAGIIKRVSADLPVVVGGVHATALPEEVLEDANIDFVIRGEGEQSFAALIEGDPVESIRGLSWRSGNPLDPFVHNPPADLVRDLDSLPLSAHHLIRFELYRPAIGAYRRLPAFAMVTTRGCPGQCTFCGSGRTPVRTRSAEHILREIELRQATHGIREVSFFDDTFTVFKRNVARLCDLMIERGVDVTWSCFARTDCVDKHLLEKMHRAGCHQILFGIESADPEILKNIRKPIDLGQARRMLRLAQKTGITVRASFMLGNPGETVESMRRTIEFAKDLEPDIVLFNITTPFPGTEMFDWAKQNGYLRTDDWREYDGASALLELPTVSSEQVAQMYRRAYREFYLRPRYLLRRLMGLRSWLDVKTSVRALASVAGARSTTRARRRDHHRFGCCSRSAEPVTTQ